MARTTSENDALLGELTAIKKLLILALLRAGSTQREIAAVLGVTQATISRMFPGKSPRPPRVKRPKGT